MKQNILSEVEGSMAMADENKKVSPPASQARALRTSKNRQKKEGIVSELSAKVEKAKGFVFTNYTGLTHKQIEKLKKALRTLEAEYVVTKNTLLRRSLDGKRLADAVGDIFKDPTATLFIYADPIEPIKHLAKSIKDLKLPLIKLGFLDGKIISSDDVMKLSTLPALPVLRAQLLGQMQSPIAGFHRALSWNMVKLVLTLNAIEQKKQG